MTQDLGFRHRDRRRADGARSGRPRDVVAQCVSQPRKSGRRRPRSPAPCATTAARIEAGESDPRSDRRGQGRTDGGGLHQRRLCRGAPRRHAGAVRRRRRAGRRQRPPADRRAPGQDAADRQHGVRSGSRATRPALPSAPFRDRPTAPDPCRRDRRERRPVRDSASPGRGASCAARVRTSSGSRWMRHIGLPSLSFTSSKPMMRWRTMMKCLITQ